MWEDSLSNPSHWAETPAQAAATETFRITNSEFLKERVTAYYFQMEGRLLDNRLGLVTGLRYEKMEDNGRGMLFDPDAAFQRNADGTFVRDGAGNRVRKVEAGAVGSIDEVRVTRLERAYVANKSYDGTYPSFHANYNVTDNFLVRFAYAKTFGRPDFSNIIPRRSDARLCPLLPRRRVWRADVRRRQGHLVNPPRNARDFKAAVFGPPPLFLPGFPLAIVCHTDGMNLHHSPGPAETIRSSPTWTPFRSRR